MPRPLLQFAFICAVYVNNVLAHPFLIFCLGYFTADLCVPLALPKERRSLCGVLLCLPSLRFSPALLRQLKPSAFFCFFFLLSSLPSFSPSSFFPLFFSSNHWHGTVSLILQSYLVPNVSLNHSREDWIAEARKYGKNVNNFPLKYTLRLFPAA